MSDRGGADLVVIVPSRGRPANAARVVRAWEETGAFGAASLVFAIDEDDPSYADYFPAIVGRAGGGARVLSFPHWLPMVAKLDHAARQYAGAEPEAQVLLTDQQKLELPFALGFAGDDHVPRTAGWAERYVEALRELGTGIVYGDDLIQRFALPTQWAMTSDLVRILGRMVPAPVEHLYSDTSIMALGRAIGRLRYLGDVVIEHCHPVAGTAPVDAGYQRVNSPEQYRTDRAAYGTWLSSAHGLAYDLTRIREVIT